jgi:hypothetical protein
MKNLASEEAVCRRLATRLKKKRQSLQDMCTSTLVGGAEDWAMSASEQLSLAYRCHRR